MKLFLKILTLCIFIPSLNCFADTKYEDLDGIFIKAVDNYPALKKNEFAIGATVLPFDPYFYGFGVTLAYTRYFNKKFGWEVLSGDFIFNIQTPLIKEVVKRTASAGNPVQPTDVEQTQFIVNSNLKYVLSYGKNIFLDKHIRLNRTEILGGIGIAGTSGRLGTTGGSGATYILINLGFQLDFSISKTMSWKVEYMNHFNTNLGKDDLTKREGNNFLEFGEFKAMLAWRF